MQGNDRHTGAKPAISSHPKFANPEPSTPPHTTARSRSSLLTVTAPEQRGPFSGGASKLVMAFDVGTTYSGASYTLLGPGFIREIYRVTRYTPLPGSLRIVFPIPRSTGFQHSRESVVILKSQLSCITTKRAMFAQWVQKPLRIIS